VEALYVGIVGKGREVLHVFVEKTAAQPERHMLVGLFIRLFLQLEELFSRALTSPMNTSALTDGAKRQVFIGLVSCAVFLLVGCAAGGT